MREKKGFLMTKLTITLNANNSISVDGPLDNIVLCYGMLERAKDAIKDFTDNKKSPIITPPTNGIPQIPQ